MSPPSRTNPPFRVADYPSAAAAEGSRRRSRGRAVPAAVAAVFGAFVIASFVATPACAALYKWTDANGVVVYSDQPPPGNVKVETIAGPPPPANPNAAKELVNKEMDLKKQQATAVETNKKAAQQRAETERLAGLCRDARAELNTLATDQILLYSINEKGEQVLMNDVERRKRRGTLENFLKASCAQG